MSNSIPFILKMEGNKWLAEKKLTNPNQTVDQHNFARVDRMWPAYVAG